MASFSTQPVIEGPSTSRPPFFNGSNYIYWKMRMKSYLFSIDYQLWNIVRDGIIVSSEKEEEWTKDDIKKKQMDHKAKYIIFCSILPCE